MRELGMRLPGLQQRAAAIAELPALGLLTLAGVTPEPWTCSYHAAPQCSEELVEQVAARQPTLVAVSALTASVEEAYAFSTRMRERCIATVIGGLHATACAEEAQQFCDAVVIGNGELVWPHILRDAVAMRLAPKYQPSRGVAQTDWPLPRLDLLGPTPPRFTLQTQRGCPLACDFCGASRLLGGFLEKPIDAIRHELEAICLISPQPLLELADDNTFAGGRDPAPLLDLLRRSGADGLPKVTGGSASVRSYWRDSPRRDVFRCSSGLNRWFFGILAKAANRRNWIESWSLYPRSRRPVWWSTDALSLAPMVKPSNRSIDSSNSFKTVRWRRCKSRCKRRFREPVFIAVCARGPLACRSWMAPLHPVRPHLPAGFDERCGDGGRIQRCPATGLFRGSDVTTSTPSPPHLASTQATPTMSISTLLRFLVGERQAILRIAETPAAVGFGLLLVLSAAFAREYDGEDLMHAPWHLVLPAAASLITSALLFSLVRLVSWRTRPEWSAVPGAYRSFLGVYWMTAPLAWLYAIPVERSRRPRCYGGQPVAVGNRRGLARRADDARGRGPL